MSAVEKKWLDAMHRGKVCFDRGEHAYAVKAFEKATRVAPGRVEGWVNLGSALVESDHYEPALTALQQALSIDPRQMVSYLMMGDALRQLGRMTEALTHYEKAVSLQRSPVAINRLACALRAGARRAEAEDLLQEVVKHHGDFSLARINLANVQIERGNIASAEQHLRVLVKSRTPPQEQLEIDALEFAVSHSQYLRGAIQTLHQSGNAAELASKLRGLPSPLAVDEEVCGELESYAVSANALVDFELIDSSMVNADWSLLEASFHSGAIQKMSDFELAPGAQNAIDPVGKIAASIGAADSAQEALKDEIEAEVQLRQWHAIAVAGAPEFMPGHFKYTRNVVAQNPRQQLVEPASTIGTYRHVMRELYPQVKPGLPRAIFVWMALCKIHPFVDGNGRIGRIWLNRELLWAGQMPALFPDTGLKAALESTMRQIYSAGDGDVAPILPVFIDAQRFASECCRASFELAG